MNNPRVRFAPSPTGYLHIGGARTALINYIFAKKTNGKFLLRIEDTDLARSTNECIEQIITSLKWLGITHDEDIQIQSHNKDAHVKVAYELIKNKKAYWCYCTQEYQQKIKKEQEDAKLPPRHYCNCFQNQETLAIECKEINPVIRIKVPDLIDSNDSITITDHIKGKVTVKTSELDDMIIVRSDGSPIYLLSAVCDDHFMGITHVIRGDDHFTNAFRQYLIYLGCGWDIPEFAHMPLIHSQEGGKLSKRHGAVGVDEFKNLGYLPDALMVYLYSLGLSVDGVSNISDTIKKFDIKKISKSISKFDIGILNKINKNIIKSKSPNQIIDCIKEITNYSIDLNKFTKGFGELNQRANTLVEIVDIYKKYFVEPDFNLVIPEQNKELVSKLLELFNLMDYSSYEIITKQINKFIEINQFDKKNVFNTIRWILTRQETSPNIYIIIYVIGKEQCVKNISYC